MMSAVQFMPSAGVGTDGTGTSHEVEHLHASIVEQLDRAGVQLPDAAIAALADAILADAVRISLQWLEGR